MRRLGAINGMSMRSTRWVVVKVVDYVKSKSPAELAKRKTAHVILAFVDAEPAGLVVCLEGFFVPSRVKPLLNIHDGHRCFTLRW
jgi:hypothetical protein